MKPMAKQIPEGKPGDSSVIDLKSEEGCPAAWPATFINLKSKPRGPSEVNPWEDLNKVLAVRIAKDKIDARMT